MLDCKSKRPGLLMHNKMIFAQFQSATPSENKDIQQSFTGWAYVGSANLSESAWYVKNFLEKSIEILFYRLNTVPWTFHNHISAIRQPVSESHLISGSSAVRTRCIFCYFTICLLRRNLLTCILRRGRLVKDRTTKEPKLNCRNWECGVVIPVPSTVGSVGTKFGGKGIGKSIFDDHVPVPMVAPGAPYGKRRPWFYNAS